MGNCLQCIPVPYFLHFIPCLPSIEQEKDPKEPEPSTLQAPNPQDNGRVFIPYEMVKAKEEDYNDEKKWPPGGGLTGPIDPDKFDKAYCTSEVVREMMIKSMIAKGSTREAAEKAVRMRPCKYCDHPDCEETRRLDEARNKRMREQWRAAKAAEAAEKKGK